MGGGTALERPGFLPSVVGLVVTGGGMDACMEPVPASCGLRSYGEAVVQRGSERRRARWTG